MALALLIGLLAVAGMLWQISEQLKGRNVIDVMRLELEAKKAGYTEVQWQQFVERGVKSQRGG